MGVATHCRGVGLEGAAGWESEGLVRRAWVLGAGVLPSDHYGSAGLCVSDVCVHVCVSVCLTVRPWSWRCS